MNGERPRDAYGRPLPAGRPDELERVELPETIDQTVLLGARLFDERRFFEAHECFERVWRDERLPEPERETWKGVTQIAVGCCHVQRDNAAGAVALLRRGARRIGSHESLRGTDPRRLATRAEALAHRIEQGGIDRHPEFPGFPYRL